MSPKLPHMPDRVAELRRQRALIAEHLAWLDRELAATAPSPQPANTPAATQAAIPAPAPISVGNPPPPVAPPKPPLDPSAILAAAAAPKVAPAPEPDPHAHLLPERPSADIKQDVRLGCLLYVVLGAVGVVGFCALIYWGSQKYKASHPKTPPHEQVEGR